MQRLPTFIDKIFLFIILLLVGCRPDMPVTSSIFIDADGLSIPVNQQLYGLTLEEINHAIEGGLYGELIQNRSFEDGILPLHSRYDAYRNVLITPNGWSVPFVRPDSIPGWYKLSPYTYLWPDAKELINDKNRRSLQISVSASSESGRGGVAASGYQGIELRKGEKYNLTFYIKGGYITPRTVSIALEDSSATHSLSDIFRVHPTYEWKKYSHTFTVNETTHNGILTFSADSSFTFWLDMISLFPENTWKERPNGLRLDLMEKIADLNPKFIRFPGGTYVEGYTGGTYPSWKESIGNIAERRHFWNVWGYGSSNGMGYHEYLQLCEDLDAEPIYVINSGVTSQSRRPRYEDITAMDRLVTDALDAIAYANEPADSIWGALRAANGHPAPFDLKYIEIGSENYGYEYARRFRLFKNAIQEKYPEITVMSSSPLSRQTRLEWVDQHLYAGENFFISNFDRYENRYNRRDPFVFVGEMSVTGEHMQGTLRGAIAEACFYIGAEGSPDIVKGVAYAPVLGNARYEYQRYPFIQFDGQQIITTPSYHVYQLYTNHRGDEILKTEVNTYSKPQVSYGRAGIWMFDNSFEFKEVAVNSLPFQAGEIKSGDWKFEAGKPIPAPNQWNYLLIGDSTDYNYEFTATLQRTKGSGQVQLRVRDNGLSGEQNEHIGIILGGNAVELYHQSGSVRDTLISPVEFSFESHRWYTVKIKCKDDKIGFYIDNLLSEEITLPALPSLVSIATREEESNTILLKVVNTTMHEERTELNIRGANVSHDVEIWELSGLPDGRNTFENPEFIIPRQKEFTFPTGRSMVYTFPPNSVTILKMKVN